jgi:hypothetical protein
MLILALEHGVLRLIILLICRALGLQGSIYCFTIHMQIMSYVHCYLRMVCALTRMLYVHVYLQLVHVLIIAMMRVR